MGMKGIIHEIMGWDRSANEAIEHGKKLAYAKRTLGKMELAGLPEHLGIEETKVYLRNFIRGHNREIKRLASSPQENPMTELRTNPYMGGQLLAENEPFVFPENAITRYIEDKNKYEAAKALSHFTEGFNDKVYEIRKQQLEVLKQEEHDLLQAHRKRLEELKRKETDALKNQDFDPQRHGRSKDFPDKEQGYERD